MRRAMIDPLKCGNCSECNVAVLCPQKAIIRELPTDKPWIDFMQCRGCMKCKTYCPNDAVLEEVKSCNGGFARSW